LGGPSLLESSALGLWPVPDEWGEKKKLGCRHSEPRSRLNVRK